MIFQGDASGDMVSKTNVFGETLEIFIFALVYFRQLNFWDNPDASLQTVIMFSC